MMTLARGLLQVAVLFTFAYGFVSLLDAGKAKLQAWRALRRVPRRGIAPVAWVRGPDGTPVALDLDERDIVTEGLGAIDPWPGIAAINAVRAANPRLTDMHAYAVAKARHRLAVR